MPHRPILSKLNCRDLKACAVPNPPFANQDRGIVGTQRKRYMSDDLIRVLLFMILLSGGLKLTQSSPLREPSFPPAIEVDSSSPCWGGGANSRDGVFTEGYCLLEDGTLLFFDVSDYQPEMRRSPTEHPNAMDVIDRFMRDNVAPMRIERRP